MSYDRENFDSEYLCPHCGELLYLEHSTPPTEVCLNRDCQLWPSGLISTVDATQSAEPQIYRELQDNENQLVAEISNWKPGALARYAYKARRELITMFLKNGVMPGADYWFAIGELLLMTNKHPSRGTTDSLERFRYLLEVVRRWSQDQRNLEDLRTKRYVLGRTESGIRAFWIKFAEAVMESQRGLGIVSYTERFPIESMFPYIHLEVAATPNVDPSQVTDAAEILGTLWPTSLQLRYVLRSHYRTWKQYDYRPDVLDMTVLFGWYIQTWGKDEISIIPADKEQKEIQDLQSHFNKHSTRHHSAEDFIRHYVDSTELVPICVRTPEGFLMDYLTLLFFLIYLQGCPDPEHPAAVERGPLLDNMRQGVAVKFEDWLRNEVHNLGYLGPEQAVREYYEYDIMAISEDKRVIIVADPKYRDMAPSSFTGTNLIEQELLGDHGLRDEAIHQQQRLEYFRDNPSRFGQYLNPQHPWAEYEIRSYLVTKQIPLAHRYKETRMVRAIEFLTAEL